VNSFSAFDVFGGKTFVPRDWEPPPNFGGRIEGYGKTKPLIPQLPNFYPQIVLAFPGKAHGGASEVGPQCGFLFCNAHLDGKCSVPSDLALCAFLCFSNFSLSCTLSVLLRSPVHLPLLLSFCFLGIHLVSHVSSTYILYILPLSSAPALLLPCLATPLPRTTLIYSSLAPTPLPFS